MKEAIVEHAKEKAQDEERQRNIIIYRLPESDDDDQDKRKDYDKSLFEKLSKNELGIAGVKPTKIIRLGRRDPELTRPLLVTTPTVMDKRRIMASLNKLKNASEDFSNISVSNDLTKEERQERQNLVLEAKCKQEEDGQNQRPFRIRGPPGKMRIVWIEEKNPVRIPKERNKNSSEVPLICMLTNVYSLSNKTTELRSRIKKHGKTTRQYCHHRSQT